MKTWKIELPIIVENERTPLVEQLLDLLKEQNRRIDLLTDEIKRLKDLKTKPKIKPSKLRDEEKKGSSTSHKKTVKKSSSNLPTQKTVDRTEFIKVDHVAEGSRFKGYRDYHVQELVIHVENILYKLERWQLPDGSYVLAQLPSGISNSHFGAVFKAYALHQHHHQGVTQPLLLAQLREWGAQLSSGQLNRLLIDEKERFHREKDEILPAALSVSSYIHVDDTGARHDGKNGYCTHIGNELFAWFKSTDTKSRINFLELLRDVHTDYCLTRESFAYMKRYDVTPWVVKKLTPYAKKVFNDKQAFENCLNDLDITHAHYKRLVTEAALIGSILRHGFSKEIVIVSDDAGQFNVFLHALCWIHAERLITSIIPTSDKRAKEMEWARGQIWTLYHELVNYKAAPTPELKLKITQQFNQFCKTKTDSASLRLALNRLYKNKEELLLVLKRPEIPLHNNLSESDIREYVKRRKISGSTRSEAGRRCRDTFTSLKKTALKLGVPFWNYLLDRLSHENKIPTLANMIIQAAT